MRGPRFPKNRRGVVGISAAHFGSWQVEHLQGQECRFRHYDRAAPRRDWFARCAAKRAQLSVVGERSVKSHQVFHCDFGPAQRKRQSITRFRARQFNARGPEEFIQCGITQLGCEFDRWEIATPRERVTGTDGTNEFAIEIFRIVVGETAGRVRQDRQWMNQSLLESERIDEGFKSGTGRARRACSVHLSLYVSVEE